MLRRSARNKGKAVDYANIGSTSLFPDELPTDDLELTLQGLNSEAFPSSLYARVDDILVHSLFATKSRPHGYRALHPEAAGGDTGLTDEVAMAISKIISEEISHDHPTKEECSVAAMLIWTRHYELFPEQQQAQQHLPIIGQ